MKLDKNLTPGGGGGVLLRGVPKAKKLDPIRSLLYLYWSCSWKPKLFMLAKNGRWNILEEDSKIEHRTYLKT